MENKDIISLLDKYQSGACSIEEKAALESWYNTYAAKYAGEPVEEDLSQEVKLIWNNIQAGKQQVKVIRFNYKKYAIAAAVAAITLGVWLYYTPSSRQSEAMRDLLTSDIAPGRNTATLTLANGKIINLDTTKTSVIVTDSVKTMVMLTASTPAGGTYQVTLPDGTDVWLNADSKISFPSQFNGAKRKVTLDGEAYFQVAKDKAHPFIVLTENQQVEVLGTHFNVSAYKSEVVKTTLLEGSVKIGASKANGLKETVLKPGEQASLTSGALSVKEVNADYAVAWTKGYFLFNNETLETAMLKIGRWYNVEVVYDDPALKQETLFGTISRFSNISAVFKMIERADVVRFSIEDNTVHIKRKKSD